MVGGVLCRVLTTLIGFAWPAYQCFKDLEKRKTTANLKNWCIYWIVLALYTSVERFVDVFLFWLPLYNEVKIAFIYFLSQMGGAQYLYTMTVHPMLLENEAHIDDTVMTGQRFIQAHVKNNISWVTKALQTRMFDLVAMVQKLQNQGEVAPKGRAEQYAPAATPHVGASPEDVPMSIPSRGGWRRGHN